MRVFVAVFLGRLISFITRTFKVGGGSAAPGLYALKIEPNLVNKLSSKITRNVIITGTNGKTTTARILAHLAKAYGLRVVRNHTGSNLERGIASALISHSGQADLGIWEVDEAAFNGVAKELSPDVVVFLNAFRDQLDRYGEVDTVVRKWGETVEKLPLETILLVNGDDANASKVKEHFKGRVESFGVSGQKIKGESEGGLKKLDFKADSIKSLGLLGNEFQFVGQDLEVKVKLPIPGVYHIYDAVAALSAALHLGFPLGELVNSLEDFSPAFGRVEKLPFGYIMLIKNPTGATQVLETILPHVKEDDRFLIALNDNFADGRDVSWIWDAEFEGVSNTRVPIICSGSRAYDMAVRLKYAGVEGKLLQVYPSLEKALGEARRGLKGQLYILPTYTALLELQGILAKTGIKERYWEQN